jgi:hypothetical protein
MSSSLFGQVSKVNYQLVFNKKTATFDCNLIIGEGTATAFKDRTQFNSQISIIVPNGKKLKIVKNEMPLINNQQLTSKEPTQWKVLSSINNILSGKSDIYSIVPELSPVAQYNELRKGDIVRLFSFNLTPNIECGEGVRFYENLVDPGSDKPEMMGSDFSNGFTMGGVNQIYIGNLKTINESLPVGDVATTTLPTIFEHQQVALKAGDWSNVVSYEWTGPKGFKSTLKDPTLTLHNTTNSGEYVLTVKSLDGCIASKVVNVKVQSVRKYEKGTILASNSFDDNTISAETRTNNANTKIFPNPASNYINISINGERGAKAIGHIYSLDGKMVMENVINQTMETKTLEKTIPLKLAAGIYNLSINVDGQQTDHKFIAVE